MGSKAVVTLVPFARAALSHTVQTQWAMPLGELNMKKLSTLLMILSLTAISFALASTASTAKSQRNTEDAVTASVQSFSQAQTVVGERYDAASSQMIGMTDAHADACA